MVLHGVPFSSSEIVRTTSSLLFSVMLISPVFEVLPFASIHGQKPRNYSTHCRCLSSSNQHTIPSKLTYALHSKIDFKFKNNTKGCVTLTHKHRSYKNNEVNNGNELTPTTIRMDKVTVAVDASRLIHMWCTDGGPAVVRQWSGGGCTAGGPTVVRQWSGGGPAVVRWWVHSRWSGGGPVVGKQPVVRRWSGSGPAVVRWWSDGGPVVGAQPVVRRWSGGGPAVVRRWSGSGLAVVRWWSGGGPVVGAQPVVRRWSGGGPAVVRWWSGGGPVVGAQPVVRRWSGGGPVVGAQPVVRWWVQVVVRWVQNPRNSQAVNFFKNQLRGAKNAQIQSPVAKKSPQKEFFFKCFSRTLNICKKKLHFFSYMQFSSFCFKMKQMLKYLKKNYRSFNNTYLKGFGENNLEKNAPKNGPEVGVLKGITFWKIYCVKNRKSFEFSDQYKFLKDLNFKTSLDLGWEEWLGKFAKGKLAL
ncbi:hypothetical protein LXL04_038429 [Taraxacum kok-saghyz]